MDIDIEEYVHQEIGILRKSPNSGRRLYIPDVAMEVKPKVGQLFDSMEQAYAFYQKYACAGGFVVRKGSQSVAVSKVLLKKYFVCTKEGFNAIVPKKVDTLVDSVKPVVRRSSSSKRTGCGAYIRVELVNGSGKWKVYKFVEEHNHGFVDALDMHLLPSSRHLTQLQKHMIYSMSTINIGPVKTFNIMRTAFGGFEDVGASRCDFKNFKRDLNLYIGEFDAEMAVSYLMHKKMYQTNYTCDYFTDSDNCLVGLFWADEECKRNYYTFGDVMSFDATYRSNRYSMVFVPFTGIDNHSNNVTFGAALLGSETADTYKWLLTCFLKAFGEQPLVVVTDQDPAMKKAISEVFTTARHRFCMWHIMHKLSLKVGAHLCNSTDFKKDICNIVWTDALTPTEFEDGWAKVIEDYKLTGNDWLIDIFGYRDLWIPAYFRDEFLSGLMRTTSRSESENHFFGQVCNSQSTLVEFMTHYETAIESQRHTHRKNDHETRYTNPGLKTDNALEKQAAEIYTRSVFLDVQNEIVCIGNCLNMETDRSEPGWLKFFIKDWRQQCTTLFEVKFCKEEMTIFCTCKRYEQFGLFCRHVFYVLRSQDIWEFPKKYILRRWRRDVVPNISSRNSTMRVSTSEGSDGLQTVMRDILFATEYNMNRLSDNLAELSLFKKYVEAYKEKADALQSIPPSPAKRDRFAELTGHIQNDKLPVRNPVGIRTKGCGTRERLKSKQELAIGKSGKKSKQCQNCYEYGHYATTCTNAPASSKALPGSSRSLRSSSRK